MGSVATILMKWVASALVALALYNGYLKPMVEEKAHNIASQIQHAGVNQTIKGL